MSSLDGMHPTDDQLELLVLGRVGREEQAHLEEHLVACAMCAQRLEDIVEYVRAMQEALRNFPDVQDAADQPAADE